MAKPCADNKQPAVPEEGGNGQRADRLTTAYQELRDLAGHYLSHQRPGHTLQPTALVHETYLRLMRQKNIDGLDVAQFFGLASKAMRSVLVDHARRRGRIKRGRDFCRVPLDDVVDLYEERAIDLIALDEALTKLAADDPQQAQVVELRFFGGLTEEETAEMLGVSSRTVGRVWLRAKAWLHNQMDDDHES